MSPFMITRQRRRRVPLFALVLFCLAALGRGSTQQAPDQGPQQAPPPSGVATGGVYAPIRDEQMRPITEGGFVDDAPVVFADVTKASGLSGFRNRSGTEEKQYILEIPSGGVALLDFDNDGWLDVYLVNGSTFAALKGQEPSPRAALYRNKRDGTFTDVTAKAEVANERWGFGVAVGDFDNDGWADLYVTNFGANRLYRNNGDGTFIDVADSAGVTLGGWSTAAAFGDYNRDGYLDLFVAGYLRFDLDNPPTPGSEVVGFNFCQFRGQRVMCGPRGLPGERDYLFRNNGDGTFTEVAEAAGVLDPEGYYGFAAAWADLDDDGWLDLMVANDSTPNHLYRNRGDGTFEDLSYASGFALNEYGREQACMGIAVGDYDGDGRLDLYVTNFSDDYNTLYRNDGEANFSDITFQAGLGEATIPFLGWGTGFLDYDNDGRKDLFVANGHVYRGVDNHDWGTTWAQRPLLFRNRDGARFESVPPATGSGLAVVVSARGAAFGDLDNDGRIDVVLNNVDSPPTVLRNVSESMSNWLTLKLVGGPESPRDATGAVAFLTASNLRQRGDVFGGDSYSSHSDQRIHFGLGSATEIEKLEIRWPSGEWETIPVTGVNRILTIEEGKGILEEKKGRGKKK